MKPKFQTVQQLCFTVFVSILLLGCSNDPLTDSVSDDNTILARSANQFKFITSLSGSNEVPANNSKATGTVIVTISQDETSIHYKLIVANIKNVLASHFHYAPPGINGGVVTLLYMNSGTQPTGPANGILAEGVITADDVSGAFAGDLQMLIDAIRSGDIYVNVHTTGIPSGEIRGQL